MTTAQRVRAPAPPTPRPRPPEGRAHLRVAPDTRRRRRRTRIIVTVACLVTVASLFTLVAFHVFAAQSAFTLDRLAKQRTNEQLRYERLRDEVARLSSPASVISAAQALGMKPSSQPTTFINAPRAAPRGPAASSTPPPLANTTYGQTKKALDQNP
jgi:hypothetical protein